MSKLLLSSTLVALLLPVFAYASVFGNPIFFGATKDVFRQFVMSVMYIGSFGVVILIVWTGFLFTAAQGNEELITHAKKQIVTTTIAAVLLLSLWAIITVVGNTVAGLSVTGLLLVIATFFIVIATKK